MSPRDELRRLATAATPGPWIGCAHVAGTDPECPCRYRGDVSAGDKVLLQLGVGPDHPDGRDEGSGWKSIPTTDREQGYANGRFVAAANPATLLRLLDDLDALERALTTVIAAYENTSLDHDVAYEDFTEVFRHVRYERWIKDRDARAALAATGEAKP